MMNIVDYCKWRGDLSFKQDRFNEVDNLIFAEFSYINFDGLINSRQKISIKDLYKTYTKKDNKHNELFFAMAQSKRYGDCFVHNYVSILHEDSSEQFSAVMVDIDIRNTIVCFRGTDNTRIGWKEDLILSYGDIKSETDAVEYLNKNCKHNRKYRLVGHSKGGHLGLYGAVMARPYIQRRIIEIISNDGPGLRPNSYNVKKYNRIKNKYYKIMPENSVVGTIYDDDCKKLIVKSNQYFIMQHEGYSWNVIGNRFESVEKQSEASLIVKQGFVEFLNNTTVEQRKLFVDEFFETLKKMNIEHMSDLDNGGLLALLKTIKQLKSMNLEAKETGEKFITTFSGLFSNEITNNIKSKKNEITKLIKTITKVI